MAHSELAGQNLDILIVEDDVLNARLLTRFCNSLGHRTRLAEDGAEALRMITERVPEFVLLDLMLPHIDGFGVLAHIRSTPRTQTLPVIMVTAVNAAETHARLVTAGADDIVTKPYRFKQLQARMEAVYAARKHLATLSKS